MTRAVHAALAAIAALTLGASSPAAVLAPAALGAEPVVEVPLAKTVGVAITRPEPAVVRPEPEDPAYVGDDGEVVGPERLARWLEEQGSPMADYASDLVVAGIAHDVDPRLVVAIAMIESAAGRHKPPGSHNAWGWGGSSGLVRWGSWPEGIHTFTARFAVLYDADSLDRRMASKYCPPCADHWLSTVRAVYEDI